MRTVTVREHVSTGDRLVAPTSTPKRNRVVRTPRNGVGTSCCASVSIRVGACSTETEPFAELHTLHITIREPDPAGPVTSSVAMPSRATLKAVSRVACEAAGGRIVADTASEPFAAWACAAGRAGASIASIAANASRASESECQRADMTSLRGFRLAIGRRVASRSTSEVTCWAMQPTRETRQRVIPRTSANPAMAGRPVLPHQVGNVP